VAPGRLLRVPFSEYLVKNKYAAADKLTLNGGSNGGREGLARDLFRTDTLL
jgi:hypothetical protein